ncbi:MAG: hypothetical protein M3R70_06800 [Actinomycetota bacterium]|nr:hypothetical protein [Actinomycetota bacterium]
MAERSETDSEPAERVGAGTAYGLTRATITLIGAAGAGLLVWLATQIDDSSASGYWSAYGLIAAAGLVMALSQLLGGWTKWGWPRLSMSVFLWAFVPVAVAVLWIFLYHHPTGNWFTRHIRSWSGDIGIDGVIRDFRGYIGVLIFGLGLVFGYTFDTTGPAVARRGRRPGQTETTDPAPVEDREAADAPVARDAESESSPSDLTNDDQVREERPAGGL